MSNTFRMTALIEDTRTAKTISHATHRPTNAVNASMARLTPRSACKVSPPSDAAPYSTLSRQVTERHVGLCQPGARSGPTKSARYVAVNWKFRDCVLDFSRHRAVETKAIKSGGLRNGSVLSASHTHVPRDGRLVVAAVDNEVMALGFEADGAVDGLVQQTDIA